MSPFQTGAMEGFGFVVATVFVVGMGMALCGGVLGFVVWVWRWTWGLLHIGGCA